MEESQINSFLTPLPQKSDSSGFSPTMSSATLVNLCTTLFREAAAAAAKSLQSCPTLCDPIDGSPPGSSVPGILQARILEWVAISFSNAWKWKVKVKSLSCVRLLATPWTAAHQVPPSMVFSRQEYWGGVPSPSLFLEAVSVNSSLLKDGLIFLALPFSLFLFSYLTVP